MFLVLLVAIAGPLAFFKVSPILPSLMGALSLNNTQGGLINATVFSLAGIVMAIPGGIIVSRLGNWLSGLIALFSIIVGALIGIFADSITPLIFSRIIEGVGLIFMTLVGPNVIAQAISPKKRGLAMGIFMTFMSIGCIIAYNVAPRLVEPYGWQGAWWFTGIYALIFFIIWLLLKKIVGAHQAPAAAETPAQAPVRLSDVLKVKEVWLIIIMFAIYMISFEGVFLFLPTFMVTVDGFDQAVASSLASIAGFVGILGSILGGIISDKLHTRKWMIFFYLIILGVLYILIPYIPNSLFVVMIILLGLFANGLPPIAFTAVTEVVNPQLIAMAIGMITLMQFIGLFFSTTIFGLFVDGPGWTAAFIFCAVISVIGAFFVLAKKIR